MRSVLALGATGLTALTLSGCGDSGSTSTTSKPAPAPAPVPTNHSTPAPNQTTPAPNTTNHTTTPAPNVTNMTTPAPAPAAPTDEELVAEFNAMYADWDPDNETSSLGLLFSTESPLDTRCDSCNDGGHRSDCHLSAALLNHHISVPGKSMLFREGTVGGFLYWPETIAPMVMCSYGMDGATDGRINHGCGCEAQTACHGNDDCPSACENTDPQTGHEFLMNSTMFSRCHCRPGDTLNEHCFWKGPSFYHGEGPDELRSMAKQRHQFMGSAMNQWNEVVISSQMHDQSLQENAAGLIAAFVIPVNAHCDHACQRDLLALRDSVTERLNLAEPLPVVSLNVDGGDTPFEVYNPFTPPPGPGPNPGPGPSPGPSPEPPAPAPAGSCCWGGDTCETASNCHGDAFCGSGEEQCTGSCSGVWCAQVIV